RLLEEERDPSRQPVNLVGTPLRHRHPPPPSPSPPEPAMVQIAPWIVLPRDPVAAHDRELKPLLPLERPAVEIDRDLLPAPHPSRVALAAPARAVDLPRDHLGLSLGLGLRLERRCGVEMLALIVDQHDVVMHLPPPHSPRTQPPAGIP